MSIKKLSTRIVKWNFPTTHDCPLEPAVSLGGPGPRDSIHISSYIRVMLWYKTINWTLKRAATWARPRHNWRITFYCLGRTLLIHDLGTYLNDEKLRWRKITLPLVQNLFSVMTGFKKANRINRENFSIIG